MTISSLVVEATPDCVHDVARSLAALDGVEVCGADEETGNVAVVVEAESIKASHALASSFIHIEGVRGVDLVYANFEDENLAASDAAPDGEEGR